MRMTKLMIGYYLHYHDYLLINCCELWVSIYGRCDISDRVDIDVYSCTIENEKFICKRSIFFHIKFNSGQHSMICKQWPFSFVHWPWLSMLLGWNVPQRRSRHSTVTLSLNLSTWKKAQRLANKDRRGESEQSVSSVLEVGHSKWKFERNIRLQKGKEKWLPLLFTPWSCSLPVSTVTAFDTFHLQVVRGYDKSFF